MSFQAAIDPNRSSSRCPPGVEMVIVPRSADVGGFAVRRVLPSRHKRMVGPFVFWDQMGPGELVSGQGMDVLPHPHIGLSTVTYLFDGAITHRDSIGTEQEITPGAINLMTAGRGVAHSERSPLSIREQGGRYFGIQSWLALPAADEEMAPTFAHHAKEALPRADWDGVDLRVIMGSFGGLSSPVTSPHDALYVDVLLQPGAGFSVQPEAEERALYPLEGRVAIGNQVYEPMQLLVLAPGATVDVRAVDRVRLSLLGGAVMDGPRYIWWNFVSSSRERIEAAQQDWKAQRFAHIPGEADAFVPLPDYPLPKLR